MSSFDTNIVLKLITRQDPELAERIEKYLEQSKLNSVVVADIVFAEAVWILGGPTYAFPRQLIVKALTRLISFPQLSCNKAMLAIALPMYEKDHGISYVDATLVAYARLNNATPLLSRDRKLTRLDDVEFFE